MASKAFQAELARRRFDKYCEFVHGVKLARHMMLWVDLYRSENPVDREIAIAAPPEFWKSRVNRMYLEWSIGKNPEWARLLVMNTSEQAQRQIMSVQDTIVNNPNYRLVFPHVQPDYKRGWNRTTLYVQRQNSARPDATLYGTGVLGPIQGGHFEEIFLDDVTDQQDVSSPAIMRQQREWVRGVLSDRLMRDDAGVPVGRLVAILTRWGDNDLWPTFTSTDPDEGMGMKPVQTPAINRDEAYPWGELLWPEEYPAETLDQIRRRKGGRLFTLTYLCDPTAAGGLLFKRTRFQRYDVQKPPQITYIVHSWDTAGGMTDAAARSVFQEWGVGPLGFYLLFAWQERVPFHKLVEQFKLFYHERPRNRILIENRFTGASLIQTLEADGGFYGIEPVDPRGQGDKEARAQRIEPLVEQGRVWLPLDGQVTWLEPMLNEVTAFPAGRFADHVDAMSQALEFLRRTNAARGRAPVGSYMFPQPNMRNLDDEFGVPQLPPTLTGAGSWM